MVDIRSRVWPDELALEIAQHDRQARQLLAQIVMQLARDPRSLRFLRVDQAASQVLVLRGSRPEALLALAQGTLSAPPTDPLHGQAGDEGTLHGDDQRRAEDVGFVPFPDARLPEQDGAPRWQPGFSDVPRLQLGRVVGGQAVFLKRCMNAAR